MKLIDKAALVAEINRLKKKNDTYNKPSHIADVCYKELLSFIDTLEVKEADLEKELNIYLEKVKETDEDIMFGDFARHFFELGLKTKKGE